MTYPRAHLVDTEYGGFYHCVSRCVRRAWLCGKDPISGHSYEHRKQWVESYLLRLANIFTVNLFGCANELIQTRHSGWSASGRQDRLHPVFIGQAPGDQVVCDEI